MLTKQICPNAIPLLRWYKKEALNRLLKIYYSYYCTLLPLAAHISIYKEHGPHCPVDDHCYPYTYQAHAKELTHEICTAYPEQPHLFLG